MPFQTHSRRTTAFTLIELLIVVAIIAILAAIAVPNFLTAQTRAKIARVRADMRSVATATESYWTDYNGYPDVPNNSYARLYIEYISALTTPVAYIASVSFQDPFQVKDAPTEFAHAKPDTTWLGSYSYFRYDNFWSRGCYRDLYIRPGYSILSHGPSRVWSGIEHYPYFKVIRKAAPGNGAPYRPAENFVYDPSNGVKSQGGIARFGGLAGVPSIP